MTGSWSVVLWRKLMTWFVVGPRWPAMAFGDLGGLVRASSQGVLVRKRMQTKTAAGTRSCSGELRMLVLAELVQLSANGRSEISLVLLVRAQNPGS